MKTNAKIYVMRSEDGRIKLGHSVDPARRAKEIGPTTEVIHETDVIEHAERIERLAHRVLALHGKHLRGEWFEATIKDAVVAIEIATRQAEGEELNLGGCLRIVAETKDKQTSLRLSEATLSSLDQLRRDEADLPTRAEMIRRLIERAVTKRPTRSKSEN